MVLLQDTAVPELKILKAVALLDTKEYAKTIATVTDAFGTLDRKYLPEALMIRAKAILAQSGSVADKNAKQKKMVDAAVEFMRVAAHFQGTPQAGEALYNAGKIMADMPKPNNRAATKAFQAVFGSYAGTPIGMLASKELKKLGAKQ